MKYIIVDDFGNVQGYGEFDTYDAAQSFIYRCTPRFKWGALVVKEN